MSRAGVRCSANPSARKNRLSRSSVIAAVTLGASRAARISAVPASSTTIALGHHWCSSHSPGVRGASLAGTAAVASSSDTPRSAAVRTRAPVGTMMAMSDATTTISIATDASDCHRKMVCVSGMRPSVTTAASPVPPATTSRMFGGSIPGVAIWSAAEPLRPCAQTLPSPSRVQAASVR